MSQKARGRAKDCWYSHMQKGSGEGRSPISISYSHETTHKPFPLEETWKRLAGEASIHTDHEEGRGQRSFTSHQFHTMMTIQKGKGKNHLTFVRIPVKKSLFYAMRSPREPLHSLQ